MIEKGRPFYKLTGSGNDFVFVDVRREPAGKLALVDTVRAVCARGQGVGADGIVFFGQGERAPIAIRYLNSDGSVGELCGNATLCAARLATELGIVSAHQDFTIATDSGDVTARFRDGLPEIDLQPVVDVQDCFEAELELNETRLGFALVGVPHLVVLCTDLNQVPVVDRGRRLRHLARLAHGANVNFVSRSTKGWRIRTYERGVEAETLACGTGAVATALLLAAWGEAGDKVELETKSGRSLHVRHHMDGDSHRGSLSGEARIVFVGNLAEIFSSRS
ncbi:MAG TPA: diaminopimelate epimerase [Gemmatimonadaceae bacterium]|nr:diaminopimelate epimerase [Gemmatimonadaceae bacterium]